MASHSSKSCTSRASFLVSTSSGPESKYYKMKKLVVAIREYLQNNTEELELLVNRYLQALSTTLDLSIFDPHTNIATEFYVSLYELMRNLDARSACTWNCVDVLSNACRNSSARLVLIETYQFLPSLSRILVDQITNEKKLKLLKLMQDLTCGIKISFQIPHLPHLMKTLARWVESHDEEIATLSLGILVNLCYKNLPAIYTLHSNVEMKKLMRTCLTMKGPIVEAHTCKLLIICDRQDLTPAINLRKLVSVTFMSVKKALDIKDHILLRQLIDFYMDVETKNSSNDDDNLYELYEKETADLIKVLEVTLSKTDSRDGQGDTYNLSECIALIFKFIHHLIEMKIENLKQFYPKFVHISLSWIQNILVSPQSVAILKTIALNTPISNEDILKPIGVCLPDLLLSLESGSHEEFPTNSDYNKKIGALFQLLRVLMRVEGLRTQILMNLKEEVIFKVFYPLVGDDSSRLSELNCSEESVSLYINAITLVDELAKYDVKWDSIRENLLKQRQIHYIISHAMYNGSSEIKSLVFNLAQIPTFPRENIASVMTSMQSICNFNTPFQSKSNHSMNEIATPLISFAQIEKLDSSIEKLKDVFASKESLDIATSEVMEFYEFKLAAMRHAERATMESVEAASERCTHLQHRNSQLIAEMNELQQVLFRTQQRNEEISKNKQQLQEILRERQTAFEAAKGRCKVFQSKLNEEERRVESLESDLEDSKKKFKEVYDAKNQLEEQHAKLKQLISKLEDNCSRLEKNLMKKEDALKKSSVQNEELRTQITSLELEITMKHELLEKRSAELREVIEDLNVKKQIIDTITKVAQQTK